MKVDISKILKEYWEDEPDKWGLLEIDVREMVDQLIEKHKPNWNGDQYAIIGAIEQIFDGMFAQVNLREHDENDEEVEDQQPTEEKSPSKGEIGAGTYQEWQQLPSLEGTDKGKWTTITPTISTQVFWSVVKRLVQDHDEEDFEEYGDMSGNYEPYERYKEFESTFKLFGIDNKRTQPDSMVNKIFHTAAINYHGIKDGEINNFNDLVIPELNNYEVDMRQTNNEYIEYTWKVPITAFSANDAETEVYTDEDGMYSWYEFDREPGFHKEWLDEEQQEREVERVRKV